MGSTDEEAQTVLLGGELGVLAQAQAEAAQTLNIASHHSLQARISTCLGQLSFNIPSGSDIRWLSFV